MTPVYKYCPLINLKSLTEGSSRDLYNIGGGRGRGVKNIVDKLKVFVPKTYFTIKVPMFHVIFRLLLIVKMRTWFTVYESLHGAVYLIITNISIS